MALVLHLMRFPLLVSALVIGFATASLYLPYLNNGLIFDDHALFTTLGVYDYAQSVFSFNTRVFPYFTLGFVQVQFGNMEAQRVVNLALHMLCAFMIFRLVRALLLETGRTPVRDDGNTAQAANHAAIIALVGALWFVLNPVAVYGAWYLTQRTILFATLFSLLSLWFFRRSFAENRTLDVVTAALFYWAAIYSKEHAVMLPAVALPLAFILSKDLRSVIRRTGLFWLLCLPASIDVVLSSKHVIATTFELHTETVASHIEGIPLMATEKGKWIASGLFQANLFWDYLGYWIVPDIRFLSIDMRIDFSALWNSWWFAVRAGLFIVCPFMALYSIYKRNAFALFSCGLLYSWLIFLTEFASVRIQEPFVLYRSYIWAPGYVLMLASAAGSLRSVSMKWLALACIPMFAVFMLLARDRLDSLSSDVTVWADAVRKLKSDTIPGSSRILYNQGIQYVKEKRYGEAVSNLTRAIELTPGIPQMYFQRGVAYYSLQQFDKALADLDRSLTLNTKDGRSHYAQAIVLERLGCAGEATRAYQKSLQYGMPMAVLKIDALSKKAGTLNNSEENPLCSR